MASDPVSNLQRAFEVIETEWGLSPLLSPEDLAVSDHPDVLALLTYLTQLKDRMDKETSSGAAPGTVITAILGGLFAQSTWLVHYRITLCSVVNTLFTLPNYMQFQRFGIE